MSSPKPLDPEAETYRQIAVLAVKWIAPLGNPGRFEEGFIGDIRHHRSLLRAEGARLIDPLLLGADRFDEALRVVVETALLEVGYDLSTVSEILNRILNDSSG